MISPFQQQFDLAVNFFLSKQIVTRPEFDKLAAEQKAISFTAARVATADSLQTVYDGVERAIKDGTTLAEFTKEVEGVLTNPWHRETVFRTNVLGAYGRGHWENAQAGKALRPYVRYSAVGDLRTRPWHMELQGLTMHLDDPFVADHWCPWEYN